jgi:cellulose synthase/poly-beta-1,6-N-acetylglucosamine synthase-like glycosyltransferase
MRQFTSDDIKRFVSRACFDERVLLKKDDSWPKISIVTPSYNQGQFLERTILSVLNQNYPNLESIMMDGGSADRSREIIKKYESYLTYWASERDDGLRGNGCSISCAAILSSCICRQHSLGMKSSP